MNCEEIEELIGAWALGALTPDAAAEVEAHLASCLKHEEVAELRAVAQSLRLAAPEVEPPPTLKMRLMDSVRRESHRPADPAVTGIAGWLSGFLTQRPAYALGGALSAAVVAILALVLLLPGGDDTGDPVVAYFQGSASAATGQLTYLPDENAVFIATDGLPHLSSDETYQIWAIRGGSPASLGFLDPDAFDGENVDLSDVDTIAITIEPAGGSPQPTTDPVLEARL